MRLLTQCCRIVGRTAVTLSYNPTAKPKDTQKYGELMRINSKLNENDDDADIDLTDIRRSDCHIHFLDWRHYSTLCFYFGFDLLFTFYPERALKCVSVCICDICVAGTQCSMAISIAMKFRDRHRTRNSDKIQQNTEYKRKKKRKKKKKRVEADLDTCVKTKIRTIFVLN